MDRQTTVAKIVDKWLPPQLPCRLSMVSRCWPLLHTTVATAILPSADQAQSTVPLRGMVPERRCTHLLLLLWLTTCPLKGKMRANCTLLCRSVLLELKCVRLQTNHHARNSAKHRQILYNLVHHMTCCVVYLVNQLETSFPAHTHTHTAAQ